MKKICAIIIAFLLLLNLAGCGSRVSTTGDSQTAASGSDQISTGDGDSASGDTASNQTVSVDKNLLDVAVTLPARFFGDGEKFEDIKAKAVAEGIKEVKQNADGSITYKMSKAKHKEMLNEFKKTLDEAANDLVTGDDTKGIFTEIKFNNNYDAYTVKVNKENYSGLTALYLLGINLASVMYQTYSGTAQDDITVSYDIIDAASGEKIDSAVFPPKDQ